MNITYDKSVDAAYIYLQERGKYAIHHTYACDGKSVGGIVNLDFDMEGRLVGLELIPATKLLPANLLDDAAVIG